MKKRTAIWHKMVYAINFVVAFFLLLACLLSFIKVKFLPGISVLSLFVPFLFLANLCFLLYWLIVKKRKVALSLFTLIIGYLVFGSFYGFGHKESDATTSDLKIMSYNVWGFNKNGWIKEPNIGDRIITLIKNNDPDVICIQEHSRIWHSKLQQYPYRSETPYSVPRTTQAIFSKYPIVRNGSLDLPDTVNNIIYADIQYNNDTIRVYNVHLQSFSIVPNPEAFADGKESEKNYKRLVSTFSKQLDQAKLFDLHVAESPYKSIVCGDFNNTQFSNVYRIVKDDMLDSFLEKGSGFGRTYDLLGFPIRIDYILTDPDFEVLDHQNFDEKLSDHYPVMATLRLSP